MLSNVISALVGAAAALVFTVVREYSLMRRRRRNVASALVFEFRVFERKIRSDLKAVEEHHVVVFDPPYSEGLYNTLLHELPDLGGSVFLAVRTVYSQLRQVSYLKDRLHTIFLEGGPPSEGGIFESYKASCRQAISRIEESLEELRPRINRDCFTKELPPITDLTEFERKWHETNITE